MSFKEFFKNKGAHKWGRMLLSTVVIIVALIFVAKFPQLVSYKAGEFYSSKIFPIISFLPTNLANIFFTSLTEMFAVVGGLFVIVFLVFFIVKFIQVIKKNGIKKALYNFAYFVRTLLIIALVVLFVFQMMHGLNFRRTSPVYKLQIGRDEHTYEEYCEALKWAYNGMVYSRHEMGEDYNGVSHFQSNFETCVYDANGLMNAFSDEYGLNMSPNYVRAKPVMLSRLWRYTGIVGFYDMMLGEANISTGYLDITETPIIICHEIAHAKGYASETDCNILGTLACIHSQRADFRYAGYIEVYFDIRAKVIDIAKNCGYDLPSEVRYPVEVYRDLLASEQYDDIFVGDPVSEAVLEASNNVNNSFLVANGQEDGVATYEVPMDIYVDFFFNYIRESA